MITVGTSSLIKRYVYPNNITDVYSGDNHIWPQEPDVSYKYYAVITDAYQVTAEGQTKTVTLVNNNGPTNSYHYGTIVFKIEEGPDTINASFVGKDYDLGVKGGACSLSPIINYLALNAMTLRVLAVGSKLYNKKLMTVPEDVVLTGYDTESEATANAQEYLCTIEDTGYLPYSDAITLTTDSNVGINLVSEETTDEAYYAIYDLVLPEVEENDNISITAKTSRVQSSHSFNRTSSSSIAINDAYSRFSIDSIMNSTNDNVLLFTATPNSGLTIDDCANTSSTNLESYFGTEGIDNNFFVNAADGSSVTIDASNVASTTLYVYEWLSDTSEFIKLGEFKLSLGSVQAFVYKNGVANSLVRKLLYPELTDPTSYTLQLVDTNTSSNVEGNAYYLFKGIPQESTTASYYALQGNQDLTHTGSLQVNGETAGQMVEAVVGDTISIYQLVGINSDDGAITSTWRVVTAFELEAADQRIEFKTYSNE